VTRATAWRRLVAAVLALCVLAVVAGCGSDDKSSDSADAGETTTAAAGSSSDNPNLAGAKEEGQVNLIALPDTWANYKGILEAFTSTYGIDAPVANPDASSADELTAIKTLKGQDDMPDAIDVGPSFASEAVAGGLIEAYEPELWDEIPDSLKDPDGNWVGAYYGIMAIATNTSIVKHAPKTFEDLLKPEYKNKVALNGDPREAGAAFASVMAASLANGGSFDDITPGIEYFAKLKESGNLLPVQVTEASVLSGETPIVLDWTYNFPGLKPKLDEAGVTMEINVPSDGVYGSFYAQAVVKGSPHPNAAKLWLDHLVSDEGALGYLEGGAIPARYSALLKAGKVPDSLKKSLPSQDLIDQITFPTQAQTDKAKADLTAKWGPMVADA
jgi:putative spermidine/putrescine transport system substrate-binding protein